MNQFVQSNIRQVAGVHQGQVGEPGVLLLVHGTVRDGNEAHQTNQDEVGYVLEYTTGSWS
jgi:hypothetical protein